MDLWEWVVENWQFVLSVIVIPLIGWAIHQGRSSLERLKHLDRCVDELREDISGDQKGDKGLRGDIANVRAELKVYAQKTDDSIRILHERVDRNWGEVNRIDGLIKGMRGESK